MQFVGFNHAGDSRKSILFNYENKESHKSAQDKECCCHFVPPHIQNRIRNATAEELAEHAEIIAEHNASTLNFRKDRIAFAASYEPEKHLDEAHAAKAGTSALPVDVEQKIYNAKRSTKLPGKIVNKPDSWVHEASIKRAYAGAKNTYQFYSKILNRDSVDNKHMPLVSTVHYGKNYDNAFWNGNQMVYGDGDGTIFDDFTKDPDVIGHELTHGVTQHTANLEYLNQAGALNESISDVFGSCIKQYIKNQTVDQADWLIGDVVLIGPGALRSMKAPGTAYDNAMLGKDPQPATMDNYVNTTEDEGGVHINSGIPNHAFYLSAMALKGHSWDKAAKIWYATITNPNLLPTANFKTFADLTAEAAVKLYGKDSNEQKAVVTAWRDVKVLS